MAGDLCNSQLAFLLVSFVLDGLPVQLGLIMELHNSNALPLCRHLFVISVGEGQRDHAHRCIPFYLPFRLS